MATKADRTRALAQMLMQGAVTPQQGQMVGRYYVGDNIGSGMTRIGQALMANRVNANADAQELDALEQAKRAKQAAFGEFNKAVTPREVTTMEYNGGRLFEADPKTSKYTPTNKDIAAALMKYQSETGEKIDDSVVKLLAGGALGGAPEAFGTRDFTLSDRPGFVWAVGYDRANNQKVMKDVYIPEKLATVNQGDRFGFAGQYSGPRNDVAPIPVNVSPDKIYDVNAAPGKAAAVARAEAGVKREQDQTAMANSAQEALSEIDRLESALGALPDTPVGMKLENFKAGFTGGDKDIQSALGTIKQVSGRMLRYVERLPGASTDKDREVFMASAGVINDDNEPLEQRKAAARSARESFENLIRKYGNANGAQPAPAAPDDGWSYMGAKP